MSLEPGTKLGAFEITGLLGKGGMGEVYRARDTKLGRDVAIKVLPESLAADHDYLKRFEKEAKILASLDHPNIASIYEFQHADGRHFLVMQLVEGESLSARIRRGALSVREALPIFAQIARGLDAAHERGLVHRDLKPANVILTASGDAKILDFGIAKDLTQSEVDPDAMTTPMTSLPVTGSGTVVGTPHYMSPEQARGKPVDRRTDVWAFGCCLYEALTGDMPFTGETMTDIVADIIHKEPDWSRLPSGLPGELERLLKRCLEKERRRRPSSLSDIAMAFDDLEIDLRSGRLDTARATGGAAGGQAGPIRSLVVLPFENLMGDPEQQYFVDGTTDAVSSELSKIKALKVISRASAMSFKGTHKSMTEIARELSVSAVVEGSIFRAGNDVRISAQLVDGRTDERVWGDSFTGTLENILSLQAEVALAIAKEIQVAVTPEEERSIARQRPVNPAAHDACLHGLYSRSIYNRESVAEAVNHYQRAIRIDPESAEAHGGIAWAYYISGIVELIPFREATDQSAAASSKGVDLDPNNADALTASGFGAFLKHRDWTTAKKFFDRGVEQQPGAADTHEGLGWWYLLTGDFDNALSELSTARDLNPVSSYSERFMGYALCVVNRIDEAIASFSSIISVTLTASSWVGELTLAYAAAGRAEEAIPLLNQSIGFVGRTGHMLSYLAYAHAHAGHAREARRLMAEALSGTIDGFPYRAVLGWACLRLGELDRAFELFNESVDEAEWLGHFVAVSHDMDPVRRDPRYEALLRKLNFPEKTIQWAIHRTPRVSATADRSTTAAAAPRLPAWARIAVSLAVVLAVGFGAFYAGRSTPAPPSVSAPDINRKITSLAVLPLENLMQDPSQDYFVDGMTETLTAELSKISALRVISRTSVMRYKDSEETSKQIAQELGVQGLIEGSVMRVGDQVRITVQLIDAEADTHIWSETYDNTLTNVFKLHSDVALAIANQVRATVTPSEAARLASDVQVKPEALDAYLRGVKKSLSGSAEGVLASIRDYERALEIDPDFGRAWSRKGHAHMLVATYLPPLYHEQVRLADEASRRAIGTARGDGEAYYARIFYDLSIKMDWESAKSNADVAIALSPNSPLINQLMGSLEYLRGNREAATEYLLKAIDLEPDGNFIPPIACLGLAGSGQPARAAQILESYLKRHPDTPTGLFARVNVLGLLPDREAEIRAARELVGVAGESSNILLATALVRQDRTEAEGRALAEEVVKSDTVGNRAPFAIARYYLAAGDLPEALTWFEKAMQIPNILTISTLRTVPFAVDPPDPATQRMLENDRYWRLIDKMNFPPFPPGYPGYDAEQAWFKRRDRLGGEVSATSGEKRIAVLPFANISGDSDQEYFVDGMTEALTMELARIRSLRVVSRTSAMQFKNALRPMHEIADELGADVLVEGSALQVGDKVRITAQLIDGNTDQHIWADRYDGTMDDILNLQSRVALAIAENVSTALTPEEQSQMSQERRVNPEAYEAYLRGMHFWNSRDLFASIPQFQQAIALDPQFAPSYAGLANAYTLLASFGLVEPTEGFEKTFTNARRALELDPDLPDAQVAIAWATAWNQGDMASSIAQFTEIQNKYPDYAPAFYWQAILLAFERRFDEAMQKLDVASALDPIAVPVTRLRTLALAMGGRNDEAIVAGLNHLKVSPRDGQVIAAIVNAYVQEGDLEKARNFLKEHLFDPAKMTTDGFVPYVKLGLVEEGDTVLADLERRSKTEYVSPVRIIATLLGLEKYDEATKFIDRLNPGQTHRLRIFLNNPFFTNAVDGARMKSLMDQVDKLDQ